MKVTLLGTGTSTGVPQIGCDCPVCMSADPHDHRLRTSALIQTDRGNNLLIDCGPDFRQQILGVGSPHLHGILLTHIHYDHVGGLEDLRPYSSDDPFDIYCEPSVSEALHQRLSYCFAEKKYPGAPSYNMHEINAGTAFEVNGDVIVPLRVMHATLPIVGFRIDNFGYITDCKTMPDDTLQQLKGVDTLVINALRPAKHKSHMNLQQALNVISAIKPRRALLTHMAHQIGLHEKVNAKLPPEIQLAYDGQVIEV